jgi:hypothetical protein
MDYRRSLRLNTESVPGTPIARLFVKRKSLPLAQVVAPAANRQAFTPYIVVTLLSLSPLKEYALSMALHRLYPVEVAHILSRQIAPALWQYQVTITVEDVETLTSFRVDETIRLAQEIGSETDS